MISAHILPGILLFSLRFVSHNPYYCVALITTALGLNGASTVVSLANGLDLAPNYSATISALNNTFGALAGILAPMLITFYTKEQVISHLFLFSLKFEILNFKFDFFFSNFRCFLWHFLKKKRTPLTNGIKYF